MERLSILNQLTTIGGSAGGRSSWSPRTFLQPVSLWYKARTLSLGGGFGREEDSDRLFGFGGETSCCDEQFDGGGVVRLNEFGALQVWPGGTEWRSVTAEEIEVDTWYHIALGWHGDQVTGYIDGVEGLTATSRFGFDTDLESTRTFAIGVRYNTGGNFYGRAPDGTVVRHPSCTTQQPGNWRWTLLPVPS